MTFSLDLSVHPFRLQERGFVAHFSRVESAVMTGWYRCAGSLEAFEVYEGYKPITYAEKRQAWIASLERENLKV